MTQLPTKRHAGDATSVDDMRTISPAMMVIAAVVAVGVMMAVVYLPKFWGIERYGADVSRDPAAAQAPAKH